jgi:hypothetical protein
MRGLAARRTCRSRPCQKPFPRRCRQLASSSWQRFMQLAKPVLVGDMRMKA